MVGSSPIQLKKRVRGFKDLFSKDFISAFNILSISAMSLFRVPDLPFSIGQGLYFPPRGKCTAGSRDPIPKRIPMPPGNRVHAEVHEKAGVIQRESLALYFTLDNYEKKIMIIS